MIWRRGSRSWSGHFDLRILFVLVRAVPRDVNGALHGTGRRVRQATRESQAAIQLTGHRDGFLGETELRRRIVGLIEIRLALDLVAAFGGVELFSVVFLLDHPAKLERVDACVADVAAAVDFPA